MGDYDLGPNKTSMYDFWQVCRMRNLIKTEAANGSVLYVLKKIYQVSQENKCVKSIFNKNAGLNRNFIKKSSNKGVFPWNWLNI